MWCSPGRRRGRGRGGRLGLALAAAPLLGACYVYRPITVAEPNPGTVLSVDLNDSGRTALVTSVGPEVSRVEGALVGTQDGEYVIRVSEVFGLHGTRTKWSGETVSFRDNYVKQLREKRLSGGRTAFALVGVLGAVVGLVVTADLIGIGGDSGDSKGGGGGSEQ